MVNGISSTNPPFPQVYEVRQDFSAMLNALKAGDMEGAKEALKVLQQDVQEIQSQITEAGFTPYFGTRPVDDLAALESAIAAGDAAGARKAFHTLMQDLRQIRRHHLMLYHAIATRGDDQETPAPPEPDPAGNINVTA
jgi:DNA-binding FadR family transcriptional regulator